MNNLESAYEDILAECYEDYVGLWRVIRAVQRVIGDNADATEPTLLLIRRLLNTEEIVAGQFNYQEWQEWKMPIEETMRRIESEWKALDHEPNISEIVWFTSKLPQG